MLDAVQCLDHDLRVDGIANGDDEGPRTHFEPLAESASGGRDQANDSPGSDLPDAPSSVVPGDVRRLHDDDREMLLSWDREGLEVSVKHECCFPRNLEVPGLGHACSN